ncbi:SAM-dependent methyltransferase [Priestia taiwanensis]|uniref:Uncharacterized protein n=1 Tax=Priestia taiwanensis TaxID=1347902 RepID=A0A917ERZ6_9BACI|nr:SAM-dependent methyltransferase [Priestia taiwanensis]GGE79522.1 hypothetical protein GCM10007140_31400 [Priestia taiwanensis]
MKMGREFLDIFTGWAKDYDAFVQGKDAEYADVFKDYHEILVTISDRAGEAVVEFGSGTGNLTTELLKRGKKVYPC